MTQGVYAVGEEQTVAEDDVVALTLRTATQGTDITVDNNAVNLPIGTYLVAFGVSVAGDETEATDDSNWQVALYANGAVVSGETLDLDAYGAMHVSAEKTILYIAAAATSLTLVNTSGSAVDVLSAHITVLGLNV